MRFVVFAAPRWSENAIRMIEAIAAVPDVRLAVVTHDPLETLASPARDKLAGHWRVDDVLDAGQLVAAVESLGRRHGPVHRLFGAYEQLQVPLAMARERLGIEGLSTEAALNFRDKARMKAEFQGAGIPCARHALVSSEAEAWSFARQVGFPLVVKPPAGAGAQSTHQVDGGDAFARALGASRPAPPNPVLIEEFVQGEEHSFETISIRGDAVWHSLTHYRPTPLDVLRNPWIQWCLVLPREIEEPQYDDIRAVAFRALRVLGMTTGLSHMEWFRRRDGSIAISEVAARPPGAQITTVISRAHDFDFLRAWARVMIDGVFEAPPRRYAVGAAFLRGQGQGRVRAIHGLDLVQQELGSLVTDAKLPAPGQTASPSYEGEGYVILRHEETAVVERALQRLIGVVRVELG
jgi:biotin carboxylase